MKLFFAFALIFHFWLNGGVSGARLGLRNLISHRMMDEENVSNKNDHIKGMSDGRAVRGVDSCNSQTLLSRVRVRLWTARADTCLVCAVSELMPRY